METQLPTPNPSQEGNTAAAQHIFAALNQKNRSGGAEARIYRVALSNRRLVSMQDGEVTFSYKPRKKSWATMTLPAMNFMQRFLQHVLPKGFQKVRYFGFLHPSAKTRFNALKQQREQNLSEPSDKPSSEDNTEPEETAPNRHTPEEPGVCPRCGGPLRYIGSLPPSPAVEAPPQNQRGPPCKHQEEK